MIPSWHSLWLRLRWYLIIKKCFFILVIYLGAAHVTLRVPSDSWASPLVKRDVVFWWWYHKLCSAWGGGVRERRGREGVGVIYVIVAIDWFALCPSAGSVGGQNLECCEVPPRLIVLVACDVIDLFDMVMSWFLRDRVSHLIQACLEPTVNEYQVVQAYVWSNYLVSASECAVFFDQVGSYICRCVLFLWFCVVLGCECTRLSLDC